MDGSFQPFHSDPSAAALSATDPADSMRFSHVHTDSLGLGRARHYRPRMSNPKRHHYLPEFYQKAWMGDDNKVTVYRRRHGGRLDIQRKAKKSVGWENELYADLSEADPELRQRVESGF
ncbi:DUF4238 domain-containing protein [Sphingosinicella microcystinivorans]|uniref:DUF4238 domain-containing protein n=1 Tax=Sphingosinicella microcystinivorans TaxID=335406 RepID=A0AAD1D436_SPHMI|nr:DUF4238 domain-containing protein [Sphingosinicella microcystinivorans]BBE33411.1 hypothetical protein SmB9_10690 [Sphingosinicella microcystinivorans]